MQVTIGKKKVVPPRWMMIWPGSRPSPIRDNNGHNSSDQDDQSEPDQKTLYVHRRPHRKGGERPSAIKDFR